MAFAIVAHLNFNLLLLCFSMESHINSSCHLFYLIRQRYVTIYFDNQIYKYANQEALLEETVIAIANRLCNQCSEID